MGLAIKKAWHTRECGFLEQGEKGEPRTLWTHGILRAKKSGEEISSAKEIGEKESEESPERLSRMACLQFLWQSFEQDEAVKSCQIWKRGGYSGHRQSRFRGANGWEEHGIPTICMQFMGMQINSTFPSIWQCASTFKMLIPLNSEISLLRINPTGSIRQM